MSIVLIVAIVLWVLGNLSYFFRTQQNPPTWLDPLFFIVDGATFLYIFQGVNFT